MSKILVTGCSGFIGTNLMLDLKGNNVVKGIDIKKPKTSVLNEYWVNVDIRDYEPLLKVFEEFQPEYVVHLAARTDLNGSSIEDYSSNTIGVENILKAIKQTKPIKKAIITSSMLVCKRGFIPPTQFDYAPNTLYGESKVQTEKLTWDAHLECDWAILRPTSIWGPWFETYSDFFRMVKAGTYFHVGHKSCTKTYGYVGNMVFQIKQLLANSTMEKDNKVFYIGEYEPYPIEEWADEIAKEVNKKVIRMPFWIIKSAAIVGDCLKAIHIHFPMNSFRLKNMTTDNIVNLDNTKSLIPHLPFTRLEGVKETLKWLESH